VCRLAVCTSDNRDNCDRGLEEVEMSELFVTTLCSGDPEYTEKPSAVNVDVILARVAAVDGSGSIARERVVVVGDSPLDVEMGVLAGGSSVGVLSGVSTSAEKLCSRGASAVNRSLASVYIRPDTAAPHTDVLVIGGP
jgi:phosphoglycolate phosphatase-like HAD superfamily hydrolase